MENRPGTGDTEAVEELTGEPSYSPEPTGTDVEAQREKLRSLARKHRSQMRIAHEFAAANLQRVIHVSGLGWLAWDGKRWAQDHGDKFATNAVMETIRALASEALSNTELLKDLLTSQSANGAKGILALASALPGIRVDASELDAEQYALNCANGTLDLRTFELRPHDPSDFFTKVTAGAYDPAASVAQWDKFLERILPDAAVRAFFQRLVGQALVGTQLEHILCIAIGSGRNGKGVCYETLVHVLGDYACIQPPSLFEQTTTNANAASPALMALRGIRFAALSETEETVRIASATVKRLTGGDPVTARQLHQSPVTFDATWQFLLVTNDLPKLSANAKALWERVQVVEFGVQIPKAERDPQLKEKLKDGEPDGILTWAVEGLRDYWAKGGLAAPVQVLERTKEYAESQDTVSRFIDEMCTDSPLNGGDSPTDLFNAYEGWCSQEHIQSEHMLGLKRFGASLAERGFPSTKSNGRRFHVGLGLDRNSGSGSISMEPPSADVLRRIVNGASSRVQDPAPVAVEPEPEPEPDPAAVAAAAAAEQRRKDQEDFREQWVVPQDADELGGEEVDDMTVPTA